MRYCLVLILVLLEGVMYAQNPFYPAAAGQLGSTAIHKDSSAFINWVASCMVKRGWQDISQPALGYTTAGDSSMALGKAQSNGVLSLGDGGYAVCSFPYPVSNGNGFDFAVFENGFDDYFLELAFVEVSSDGLNYFRFPSHSLTDTGQQCGTFDSLEAGKLNNLAGKYRGGYGTPFDLEELKNIAGLDVNNIKYIKVLDVIGTLYEEHASTDSYGNKINDPWPTPFPQGGFDLDAIGVIHENKLVGEVELESGKNSVFFPNPISNGQILRLQGGRFVKRISVLNLAGQELLSTNEPELQIHNLASGVYFIRLEDEKNTSFKKLLVQ